MQRAFDEKGRSPSRDSVSVASSSSDSTTDSPKSEPEKSESKSTRRYRRQLMRQEKLQEFLAQHQFSQDVCEPRTPGCCLFVDRETVYPIHIAAAQGDQELIRMLISGNADLNRRTSKGRSALDFAEEADSNGSHSGVLEFLRNDVKVLGLRPRQRQDASEDGVVDACLQQGEIQVETSQHRIDEQAEGRKRAKESCAKSPEPGKGVQMYKSKVQHAQCPGSVKMQVKTVWLQQGEIQVETSQHRIDDQAEGRKRAKESCGPVYDSFTKQRPAIDKIVRISLNHVQRSSKDGIVRALAVWPPEAKLEVGLPLDVGAQLYPDLVSEEGAGVEQLRLEAGKSAGLMTTVLAEWRKVRRRQKAHSSLELLLRQWESGFAKGLQTTVVAEWLRLARETKRELKHERAHAVVELTLSQWEKGQTKGLMATVVKDWHKYTEVTASNGRKIRGAGTLEEKLLLATLRLCLHGWRQHLDVVHARANTKALHESMDIQRLNLVFVLWRLCFMEEKREQAFGQVAEISAIAFELQQAQNCLVEEKILLEGRLEKAYETLQKELQTKEELTIELREAYSKQANRSALLPDLPANLTLSPGALTHSSAFSQRVGAEIAASVASASMHLRSREGTPRADADDPKQRRTKVSPLLPGVSKGLNGTSADAGSSSELDWNAAVPRIEEMMKNMADGETPKAASAIASRGDTAERFEALGRAIEQEDGLPGLVSRSSPRSKSPTAMAAERRRRKAAERAGRLDDEDEWV
ncbi:unnamed protein product [Symbiodinium pilosum]|uniref:Uncharacterized protein n=1 Tax=Symbiodinium pilosum TaxID=2952 RepID=A0A812WKV0_SYMPI|nr:unnamed protein product [Symbiodinium pilosum]